MDNILMQQWEEIAKTYELKQAAYDTIATLYDLIDVCTDIANDSYNDTLDQTAADCYARALIMFSRAYEEANTKRNRAYCLLDSLLANK